MMEEYIEALKILTSLPNGWGWGIENSAISQSQNDRFFVRIFNDGIEREPVYCATCFGSILGAVNEAYNGYIKGEKEAQNDPKHD